LKVNWAAARAGVRMKPMLANAAAPAANVRRLIFEAEGAVMSFS
jgi:hypothetical protein